MSEQALPFLPEPDPPAPPPKSKAKRTLLLWVLLIVMFLAIWQFLSPGTSQETTAPRPPPCTPEGPSWTSTLVTIGPVLVVMGLFVWLMRRLRVDGRLNLEQEPGFVALAERRFGVAAATFATLAEKLSKKPLVKAVALYNLAYAQLWGGQLDLAIASLAKVDRFFGASRTQGIRLRAATELVFAYALYGDLETAERWDVDARARLTKSLDERLYHGCTLCLGEAVVAMRRGRPAEALSLLEKHWLTLRDRLTGNHVRMAEVLRAFAESSGGVREYNTVGERLLRIEPVVGDELAFLGARWPEMKTFLVAHRLAGGAA